jgi:glycerophosphoryl diester phosphodiesterase
MKFLFLLLSLPALTAEKPCRDAGPGNVAIPQNLVDRVQLCANAEKMLTHAHRGAGDRPENTMAAFRRAIEQGADVIELDTQMTRDDETGEPVVIVAHDSHLRPDLCLSPDGQPLPPEPKKHFWQMTLAEIRQYDCGSLARPDQKAAPGERIPTLLEAMQLLKEYPRLRLNIEIKIDPNRAAIYPSLEKYVEAVLATVKKSGVSRDRFFFQSFHHDTLRHLKEESAKEGKRGYDISPLLGNVEKILEVPYELKAHMVTPHYGGLTKEIVNKLQGDGIQVVPWTVNGAKEMRELIALGVDGIITDRVDLFQEMKREICRSGKDSGK